MQQCDGTIVAAGHRDSNQHPLHLVEAHLVVPAIVELRRACRGVVGHGGGLFERAAVLEVGGDPGRAKREVADLGRDAGRSRAPTDHRVGVCLGQGRRRQRVGASADRPKQRPLRIAREPAAVDIGMEVSLEVVVAGHFVALAALLVQANPKSAVLHVNVLNLHRERRADTRERIDHEADQGVVAKAYGRRYVDRVEQLPCLGRIKHRRLPALHAVRRPSDR